MEWDAHVGTPLQSGTYRAGVLNVADMLWLKIVTSFLTAVNFQFGEPAPQLAAPEPAKAAPAQSAMTADDLLTRLETSDEKITTLQAELLYDKVMVIAGDRQTRAGSLVFKAKVDPNTKEKSRAFSIQFDTVQIGTNYSRKPEKKQQQYIFDGEWLTERMPEDKQIIRHQVVKPGEKFDPLKIGEGPLPIPIGQKKDEILARYDVTLVDSADGLKEDDLKALVKDTWQLKLIPKPGADRNFKEIRLWYRQAADLDGKPILPRMARTIDTADDVSTVQLINPVINQKLDESKFDTKAPDSTWTVDERPYRQN